MSEGESPQIGGTMMGLVCNQGVILASNSMDYEIYLLDDRIYCCAPRYGIDRNIVLKLNAQMNCIAKDRGQKLTVSQVKDLLCLRYEDLDAADVLLVGHDSKGLHLYSLQKHGVSYRVIFSAKGRDAMESVSFLKQNWTESMSLNEAEHLVRKCLKGKVSDMCTIYRDREIEDEDAIIDEDDMTAQSPKSTISM